MSTAQSCESQEKRLADVSSKYAEAQQEAPKILRSLKISYISLI